MIFKTLPDSRKRFFPPECDAPRSNGSFGVLKVKYNAVPGSRAGLNVIGAHIIHIPRVHRNKKQHNRAGNRDEDREPAELFLQQPGNVDALLRPLPDVSESRKMPLEHEHALQQKDKRKLRTFEQKPGDTRKRKRNENRTEPEILRRKNDVHSDRHRKKTPQRRNTENCGTGR